MQAAFAAAETFPSGARIPLCIDRAAKAARVPEEMTS